MEMVMARKLGYIHIYVCSDIWRVEVLQGQMVRRANIYPCQTAVPVHPVRLCAEPVDRLTELAVQALHQLKWWTEYLVLFHYPVSARISGCSRQPVALDRYHQSDLIMLEKKIKSLLKNPVSPVQPITPDI